MKKILPLFLLTTASAFAVTINADTKIAWNAIVVVAALYDVGLNGDSLNFHPDVVLTYNRILDDLLNRKTFSAADAVSVCMQQCNKSSFLKEGRGQSGKKCPDICKNFGMALVTENNKGINSIKLGDDEQYGDLYHPLGRIYSRDKEFYSLSTGEKTGRCDDAIFESSTNKKIAVCEGAEGEGGASEKWFKVIDPKYNGFDFVLYCDYCITCDSDEGRCSLDYVGLEHKIQSIQKIQKDYEACVNVYKSVDLSTIKSLLESPLIYTYGLGTVASGAEEIFSLRDKVYGLTPDNLDKFDSSYRLREYCRDMSVASINLAIERAESSIKCVKDNFKTSNMFKDTETETLNDAKSKIAWYFRNKCEDGRWKDMQCSGICKGVGQDYVTCTLGNLSATFEFEDICEGNASEKLKNMFNFGK